jgi:hypothetical protein
MNQQSWSLSSSSAGTLATWPPYNRYGYINTVGSFHTNDDLHLMIQMPIRIPKLCLFIIRADDRLCTCCYNTVSHVPFHVAAIDRHAACPAAPFVSTISCGGNILVGVHVVVGEQLYHARIFQRRQYRGRQSGLHGQPQMIHFLLCDRPK